MYNFYGGQTCPESIPIEGLLKAAEKILPSNIKQFVNYDFQENQHEALKEVVPKGLVSAAKG